MDRLIIEAGRTGGLYWRDLWRYRELFYILAWRDILVRYKQTIVGIVWSLIRPFLAMVVLTVVFGKFGKMSSGGVPYPLLVSAVSFGITLWVAALMVEYRDFRFIIPFVVQFGLYISPVGFLSSVVPEKYRLLYSLNPMVAIIDGFRWCVLGGNTGSIGPAWHFLSWLRRQSQQPACGISEKPSELLQILFDRHI